MELIRTFFSTEGFMPHGHCYLWNPAVVWTMFVSDLLIGIAYTSISICIYSLLLKIKLPFGTMFVAFGLFIGACGITHFMEVWTLWSPQYWLAALFKVITAVASVATAYFMFTVRPKVLQVTEAAKSSQDRQVQLANRAEELTKANAELKKLQEGLTVIVDAVKDYAVFMLDPQGYVASWNDGARRIIGYETNEIMGQHFSTFFLPEDVRMKKPEWELNEAATTGQYEDEGWRLRKDGSRFLANVVITAFRDDHGAIRGFSKVTRDITERKRAEEKLKMAYEKKYRSIFESQALGIVVGDASGRLYDTNDYFLNLVGYTRKEFNEGQVRWDLLTPPEYLKQDWQAIREIEEKNAPKPYEKPYRRKDGSLVWVQVHLVALLPELSKLIAYIIDITDRKRAEDRLTFQKHLLQSITDNAASCLFMMDEHGRPTFMNPAAEDATGYKLDEIKDRALHYSIHHHHPDGRLYAMEDCPIDRAQTEFVVRRNEEEVFVRKDGSFFPVSFSVSPIEQEGKTVGSVLEFRDITLHKDAERVLRESEARFRLFAESIPQLAWVAQPDGFIYWYNQNWYRYTGKTPKEVEGWGWQSVHSPDTLPKVLEGWRAALALGETFEMEFPLKGADGKFRWFLTRASPLKNDQDEVVQWFGTNTDIDNQKLIQKEQAFMAEASSLLARSLNYEENVRSVARFALPMLADWCVIDLLNEDQTIQRIGVAHGESTEEGLDRELKKHPSKSDTLQRVGNVDGFGERALSIRPQHEENPRIAQGLGTDTVATLPLVSRGKNLGSISFFRSGSNRAFTQEDRRLIEELSSRIAIAVDNAKLYQEANTAVQARDEFMSIASHELKTPLTSLYLQLQMLSRTLRKLTQTQPQKKIASSHPESSPTGTRIIATPEYLLETVELCEKQGKKLTDLLEELFDLTRIRLGRLELKKRLADLVSLSRDVMERYLPDAEKRGVLMQLIAPEPAIGLWDCMRIEQVVSNLISNALKYGNNQPIELTVERDSLAGVARLRVRDQGMGIPIELREKVFERFERAVGGQKISGLGLGLYITRQIVDAHGGRIWVKSELGKGSTFTVELYLASKAELAATSRSEHLSDLKDASSQKGRKP